MVGHRHYIALPFYFFFLLVFLVRNAYLPYLLLAPLLSATFLFRRFVFLGFL